VTILLTDDFDRKVAMGTMRGLTKETIENAREFWLKRPWFNDVTQGDGNVEVPIVIGEIDRTLVGSPPPERDIAGQPY
jgi:hypothetical protein